MSARNIGAVNPAQSKSDSEIFADKLPCKGDLIRFIKKLLNLSRPKVHTQIW